MADIAACSMALLAMYLMTQGQMTARRRHADAAIISPGEYAIFVARCRRGRKSDGLDADLSRYTFHDGLIYSPRQRDIIIRLARQMRTTEMPRRLIAARRHAELATGNRFRFNRRRADCRMISAATSPATRLRARS